jgi:hypothetical protein
VGGGNPLKKSGEENKDIDAKSKKGKKTGRGR